MVDIHTHLLFDMDDGAQDLAESLELCRNAMEQRIEQIIATPHFLDYRAVEDFLSRRDRRLATLQQAVLEEELALELFAGAEVAASPALFDIRHELSRLTLHNGPYLLLEFPFSPISYRQAFDYLDLIFDEGLIPVIAHPERFSWILRDWGFLDELLERGAVFQVTSQSLTGAFGRQAQELSFAMLRADAIDCIASDAHEANGLRSNRLLDTASFLSRLVPPAQLARMLEETPAAILRGEELEPRRIGLIAG